MPPASLGVGMTNKFLFQCGLVFVLHGKLVVHIAVTRRAGILSTSHLAKHAIKMVPWPNIDGY